MADMMPTHFVDDILGHISDLRGLERAAYWDIRAALCKADGKLPADSVTLSRVAHMGLKSWRRVEDAVRSKFAAHRGFLMDPKLYDEIKKLESVRATNYARGKAGGIAKALKYNNVVLLEAAFASSTLTPTPRSPTYSGDSKGKRPAKQ